MNVDLRNTFEFHVQKRLTGVDGYTQVWQCIGPSIDALALLTLFHAEEGTGFSIDDVVAEGVELGLLTTGRIPEVLGMLRQDGLLAGTDDAPVVGDLALRLMAGLDANYPKMAGIVLPAFLVQILQELMDGRNELDKALDQVDQTLSIQEEEDASVPIEDPAVVEARRERFLKRITSIRSRMIDGMDRNLNVQEVTASVSKGALRTLVVSSEDPATPPAVEAVSPVEALPEVDETPKPSPEEVQREAFLALKREKMELERQKQEFLLEKKRLEDARNGATQDAESTDTDARDSMEALTRGESDEDIARAVARFEEGLSLGCPVCGTGALETRNTENGKTFYRCDNRSCGFVTWKRPYPFACPTCKNPFLVENDAGDGLACPRSVCSFKQSGLEPPQEKKAAPSGARRVRKVRRVVRKKS